MRIHVVPYSVIKPNSKVVIYGAGDVGQQYIKDILQTGYCEIVGILDKRNIGTIEGISVYQPEFLKTYKEYDAVLIAVAKREISEEIRRFLREIGVPGGKIIWEYSFEDIGENAELDYCAVSMNNASIFPFIKELGEKQIIIYGAGRRILEFEYMFPNINVKYYVMEEGYQEAERYKKRIKDFSSVKEEDVENIFIIACAYNRNRTNAVFRSYGFEYGVNWCFDIDYGKLLDFSDSFCKKRVAFWISDKEGITDYCSFKAYYGDCIETIVCKQGIRDKRVFSNGQVPVFEPEEIRIEDYFIIIAGESVGACLESIAQKGVMNSDYCIWDRHRPLPSRVFMKTIMTNPSSLTRCKRLDEYVEVSICGDGFELSLCCPVYLKTSYIGRIDYLSFDDIWNSNLARVSRLSLINRTYTVCSADCPNLSRKEIKDLYMNRLPVDTIVDENSYSEKRIGIPKCISLNIDYSCNLNCVFCRQDRLVAKEEERDRIEKIADRLEEELIPYTEQINLAGNGEVFFSAAYKKILYDERNKGKKLRLVSNGTLLHTCDWERLQSIYSEIVLCVSLGTFSEETYEKYWKGGKWNQTKSNIEQAGVLRKNGTLRRLQIYYLVTADTYKDLPKFYVWAKECGVDEINLNKIFPSGEIKGEEYSRLSLFFPDGQLKDPYRDFFNQDIFKDPIFIGGNVLA